MKKSLGLFDFLKKKKKVEPAPSPGAALNIPPLTKAADLQGNQPAAKPLPPLPDIEGKISATEKLPPLEIPEASGKPAKEEKPTELPPMPPLDLPPVPDKPQAKQSPLGDVPDMPVFPDMPKEEPVKTDLRQEIPTELPPIDTGDELFPEPLPKTAWPAAAPEQETADKGAPYVSDAQFKQIMHELGNVQDIVRKHSKVDKFNAVKTKEDSHLNQMRRALESIQRKLMYVDKEMFEGSSEA